MVAIPLFDARTVQPSTGAGPAPLPAGWVECIIVGSEVKPTKDNMGKRLVLDCRVTNAHDTSSVGKNFNYGLNIVNASQQAMDIAQRELSAICHVTGVYVVQDTAQLHNIPFRARLDVSYDPKDSTKPIGNNVVELCDIHGNKPGQSGGTTPGATHSGAAPMTQPAAPAPAPASAQAAWGGGAPAAAQPAPAAAQPATPPAWGGTPTQPAAPAAQPAPAPQSMQAAWGAPAANPAATAAQPAPWGTPAA